MKLHDQTILITGGSSGIGLAFANELSQNNTIIICGRDNNKLDDAKKNNSALNIIQCDVSDENSIKVLVENLTHRFPNLNVLINNAGVMNIHEVKNNSLPFDNQKEEVKTNILATISLSDKLIPHFIKQKEAAIINVTSGLAYMPFELAPVYTATKAAIHSYSQSMRIALKNTPISIIEILPPMVDTNMSEGLEMPGIKKISAQKMVNFCIKKIEKGKKEIQPGSSAMMIRMYKLFPNMTSKMMSKMAPKVLASFQDFIQNKK
jgi:uncharacterized oxidoreductase